jgi:cytochrome c oxidase assembly protein subunit 11
MILRVVILTMWCYRIPSSGACRHLKEPNYWLTGCLCRAKRNAKGVLEPDAPEDAVQKSLGFGNYVNAPKAEDRNK